MAALYIFPDTNLLMHFRRIDELDWKQLSGVKDVVIVLAPTVVKELGKHKDRHPNAKLRDRARNLNSWLRGLRKSEDKRLKNGVTLEVATKEPANFLGDDLDPADNDDRIIACAKAYAHEKRQVAVASDDTIMLHKLDAHGIRAIEIPEDLRLVDEAHPLEAENRKLRSELTAIKSRRPRLDLVWDRTKERNGTIVVVPVSLDAIASPAEMERQHPKVLKPNERPTSASGGMVSSRSLLSLTNDMIDRHNGELAHFYRQYESYYGKVQAIADMKRRYVKLALRLKNVGSASATHIEATMRLPEGMRVLNEEPVLTFPKAPEPPKPLSAFGSMLDRSIALPPAAFWNRDSLVMAPFDPSAAQIEDEGGTVRWDRRRLLHGTDDKFDPLPCIFADHLVGGTVEIEVELRAEELPEPESFSLCLRFAEHDAE